MKKYLSFHEYSISTSIAITILFLLVIALSACAPACGRGGPCISPQGGQMLFGLVQSGALNYHPEPITYYPELYLPPSDLLIIQ